MSRSSEAQCLVKAKRKGKGCYEHKLLEYNAEADENVHTILWQVCYGVNLV